MPDPFLSREVVRRLTCRSRPLAQRRMLDKMGISYVVDGDGYPLVRDNLAGQTPTPAAPRWDRLQSP